LRLIDLAGYLFPLLATAAIILIIYFSDSLKLNGISILAGLLFCFTPNFILIVLQMDQFLYPSMFIVGLFITFLLTKEPSFIIATLLGFYFYLCLYMTFSLIPLISLSALWLGMDYWFCKKNRKFDLYLRLFIGVALGFAITYILFYYFLNYNALVRYQNALAWHRTIKLFNSDLAGILKSVLINNLEYLLWCGAPLVLLAATFLYQCIVRAVKKEATGIDWFGLAFLVNFVVLNFVGQTRSEVGRLWFFMVPVLAIFAAISFNRFFHKKPKMLTFILSIQLITTYITYKVQDFY
jgi:hypothetical protein